MTTRDQIEADIADENRRVRMRQLFAHRPQMTPRAAASRPAPRFDTYPFTTEKGAHDYDGDGDDGFDRLHAAEADFRALCDNETGRKVTAEQFAEGQARRAAQDAMTIRLARILETRGGTFYHGENSPGACTIIGLLSGAVKTLPAVRRVSFFPSIAAQNRAKMLRDVEWFILCHPTTCRMFTITRGVRLALATPAAFRAEVQKFHRKISKIAANKRLRALGVRFQWRATEFGEPVWDGCTLTLHVHAHCLVTAECANVKKRAKWRRKIWSLTGAHWSDDGKIQNAREFVKYPVKDAELAAIIDASPIFGPAAICDLYEAIRGLHIVQPLGSLRDTRKARRIAGKRINAWTRGDGRTLEENYDHNAGKRPLAAPKPSRDDLRRRVDAMRIPSLPTPQQLHAQQLADALAAEDTGNARPTEPPSRGPRIANRIIARLAPAPFGSAVLEPAVVVWGFDGNLTAVLSQPKAAALIARHAPAYLRARAAAEPATPKSSQWSSNCPRGASARDDSEPQPSAAPPRKWRDAVEFAL